MKIYEYLATGRPIVATDLPSVRQFHGLIQIATDDDDCVKKVKEALQDKDEGRVSQRKEIARHNSWERRLEEMSAIIAEALRRKRGASL